MAGETTDELLRMIGRELQGIRKECRRTANSVGFLVAVVVISAAFALAYGFGTA